MMMEFSNVNRKNPTTSLPEPSVADRLDGAAVRITGASNPDEMGYCDYDGLGAEGGESMLHYVSCGVRNVWLLNGYHEKRTPYGRAVSIEDVEGLHRAIGLGLVRHKLRLSGAELRFLRKELDLSQARLARYIGTTEQNVSKWERQGRVPKYADRFLRALFREFAQDNAPIRELVERPAEMDRADRERLTFNRTDNGWEESGVF